MLAVQGSQIAQQLRHKTACDNTFHPVGPTHPAWLCTGQLPHLVSQLCSSHQSPIATPWGPLTALERLFSSSNIRRRVYPKVYMHNTVYLPALGTTYNY